MFYRYNFTPSTQWGSWSPSLEYLKKTRASPPSKYSKWQPKVSAHPLHPPWRDPPDTALPSATLSPRTDRAFLVPNSHLCLTQAWTSDRANWVPGAREGWGDHHPGAAPGHCAPTYTEHRWSAPEPQPPLGSTCRVCLPGPSGFSHRDKSRCRPVPSHQRNQKAGKQGLCFSLAFSRT